MLHELLTITFVVFEGLAAFGVPSGRCNFVAAGLLAFGLSLLL